MKLKPISIKYEDIPPNNPIKNKIDTIGFLLIIMYIPHIIINMDSISSASISYLLVKFSLVKNRLVNFILTFKPSRV